MERQDQIINFALWCKGLSTKESQEIKYLDISTTPKEQIFLFSLEGVGMIAESNLQTLKGIEKVGKSAGGIALIVAALRGEFLGIRSNGNNTPILWADTEQDESTLITRVRASLEMAGEDIDTDKLKVLPLRPLEEPDRLETLRRAIEDTGARLVFLDGIIDVCEDGNDYRTSKDTVRHLMAFADAYKCAILCVIHENPKDQKARGHIGTIIQQKSSEIYQTEKTGDVATIHQERGRFKSPPDFAFRFLEGFKIENADASQAAKEARKQEEQSTLFVPIFADRKTLKYGELKAKVMNAQGVSERTARARIGEAVESGVLTKYGLYKDTLYSLTFQPVTFDDDEDTL